MNFDKKKIFNSIIIIVIAVLTVLIVVEATKTPKVENNIKSTKITEVEISNKTNDKENDNENFVVEKPIFEPTVEQPEEEKKEEIEILKNEERREVVEKEIGNAELQPTEILETGEIIEVLYTVKEPKKQEIKKYQAELNDLINKRKERNVDNTFVYFNNITLNRADMKPIDTNALINKGLVIVFWSSRTEDGYKDLKKFAEIKKIEGINLMFVNSGSNIEFPRKVENFITEKEFNLKTLYDDMHSVPSTFSFSDPFKVLFLNKDGYLVDSNNSYNPKTFQDNIEEILNFYSEHEEQLKQDEILLKKIDRSRQ